MFTLLLIVIGFISMLFAASIPFFIAALSPISVFWSCSEIDLKKSELVRQVEYYTECWEEEYLQKLKNDKEKLESEHVRWVPRNVPVYDFEKNEWTYEEVWEPECTVAVYIEMNKPDMGYFYAYVCTENMYNPQSIFIDYLPEANDVKAIYDVISKDIWDISYSASDDIDVYNLYNYLLNFQEVKETLFPNNEEKQLFFENSYHIICEILELPSSENIYDIDITNPNNMKIPLYLQYQSPWGNLTYGDGKVADSGCSPTCIAMVISYLTGKNVLPSDVVSWAGSKYYLNGTGTTWNIYSAAASNWGLSCNLLATNAQNIVKELENGHPVIVSMGPGKFTSTGHFIVLRGINSDGTVCVNDPNDSASKNFYNTTFSISEILSEAKSAWSFY